MASGWIALATTARLSTRRLSGDQAARADEAESIELSDEGPVLGFVVFESAGHRCLSWVEDPHRFFGQLC